MNDTILQVKDLNVTFAAGRSIVHAVSDICFSIQKGETFALVGESGCGKSTTARAIMRLIRDPGKINSGEILFEGRDLLGMRENEIASVRGKSIGMIFQNPLDSLNPVYTIGGQISEGLVIDKMEKKAAWRTAARVLRDVQIPDSDRRIKAYPYEISGGMRQRVMIGMMLCRNPKLLIADEPTTALDVTIQAGIIELMNSLRQAHDTSILLITHDFGVVADIADRVGVMYAGEIVELGEVFAIFDRPMHPYTQLLMKALPTITKNEGRLTTIHGSVPNLTEAALGCRFADRCPDAADACRTTHPVLHELEEGHYCSCLKAQVK
jgi:oligopeptide/dipeptide ABC transporter, ATP-binding protein, C-terminal domain